MNEQEQPRSAWRMAFIPLIAGTAMCMAAAAFSTGASLLAKNIAEDQNKTQAALLAAQQALKNTQTDRIRLEENLQMFGKLRQSHFAEAPDRLRMLEALESAAKDLRHSAIEWELGPQEKIKPLNDDKTGEAVAQLVRVPMKLIASGIHEEEWLNLLMRLQGSGAGGFTTDACMYERKTLSKVSAVVPSISVLCNLSWLYVVAEGAVPKAP